MASRMLDCLQACWSWSITGSQLVKVRDGEREQVWWGADARFMYKGIVGEKARGGCVGCGYDSR
jgi:hypothetical protein